MKLRIGFFGRAVGLLLLATVHGAIAQPTHGITVENGWARKSSADKNAANIYLEIKNQSAVADELESVWTPAGESAVVMRPHWRGLTMTMERVQTLTIEPGKRISMHPGGYQISLQGLTRPYHPGESIPLELHFRNAGRVEFSVAISNKLLMSHGSNEKSPE